MADNADIVTAVLAMSAELAEMRSAMSEMPDVVAGKVLERLFSELRTLDQKDFLKLKFASVFQNGDDQHAEAP